MRARANQPFTLPFVNALPGGFVGGHANGKAARFTHVFDLHISIAKAQQWVMEHTDRQVAEAMDGHTNDLSDRFTLLISHCPEMFYTSLKDTQIDLGVSGHAHGGLVRLPRTDGLWSTSQGFLPKYTSGLRQIGESTVVISRGLGDSEPYPRIFNQPELVVLDIN